MRLVTVATYPLAHQAHLARALLEDAGVVCFVANAYGNLFPADGGIRVQVPADAADEALSILRQAGELPGGEEAT
ncbi:MAG: DUF2007 domain-containing protein [Bacteroidota bacterium]